MEMPEGWDELKALVKGEYGFPCRPKVEAALILLREMAEALEDTAQWNNWSSEKVRAALKKFKEWK